MIAILDFGSQYTQLIAKKLRALGFPSLVFPGTRTTNQKLFKHKTQGVILSGSPWSVGQGHDPQPEILQSSLPVLGLCFGYQYVSKVLGGQVEAHLSAREYGQAKLDLTAFGATDPLLKHFKTDLPVWMSHGDSVTQIPPSAKMILTSQNKPAGFSIPEKKIWALQFHPEVHHTPLGEIILKNFAQDICGLKGTWNSQSILTQLNQKIDQETKESDEIFCAVSGGVDSTVLAALISQRRPVKAIFVDHGFLREYDQQDLNKVFSKFPNIELVCVDAKDTFWRALEGVEDPETKRKTAGRLFIEVFESTVEDIRKKAGSEKGKKAILAQGTIYSDVIESAGDGTESGAHKIKSHHNVGGLPENHSFQIFEPLRELFKDEVRMLGRNLYIDEEFLERHPFPGPGLMIRCLGPLEKEKIDILRKADALFIAELKKRNLYKTTWQAFCVLLPTKTVGVMGDGRSFENVLALRAVMSSDAMTAEVTEFPWGDLKAIASRLVNEIRGINRVVYDLTSKPPATIEWE
jgi:GMP synthase (glutamine-hydrolysing)